MASSVEYILKLSSNGQTVLSQLERKTNQWGNSLDSVGKKFSNSMSVLANSAVFSNLDSARQKLDSFSQAGATLELKLKELKAITDISDTALGEIEKAAREASIAFGTDAATNVESYKTLLSQLSPEIANNIPALKMMGNNVNILSKQMGGDTQASAMLLSTAMNQFGIDLRDPIQATKEMYSMMNIMSKGAQSGAADLPLIGQALEKAGAMASLAHISFAETNAAIQMLAPAGKVGSEAGTALSRAFTIMSKGRFMPKETMTALVKAGIDVNKLGDRSLTLGQRFSMLKPIMNDVSLMAQFFGDDAIVAGKALVFNANKIDSYAKSLEGSKDAQRQADDIMSSYIEKQKRMQAQFDNIKISVFNATSGWSMYGGVIADLGLNIGQAALAYNSLETFLKSSSITSFIGYVKTSTIAIKAQALWTTISTTATNMLTASWWAANAAIILIPTVLASVAAGLAYVWYKTEGWGNAGKKAFEGLVNGGKMMVTAFKLYLGQWLEPWLAGFDQIKIAWYSVKSLWSEGADAEITAIKKATLERRKGILDNGKLLVDQAKATKDSFSGAIGALSWNSKKSVSDGISSIFGSSANTPVGQKTKNFVPGTPNSPSGVGGNGGAGGAGKSTADSISTGGTKSTNIVINLSKEVVGSININAATLKEGASEIERIVGEAMVRVLAQAQQTAL